MSPGDVRVEDGAIFDAREEARRIVAEARAQADGIRADAYSRGVAAADRRAAELAARAGGMDGTDGAGTGAGSADGERVLSTGRVTEMVGLVVRARMDGPVRHGEVVSIEGGAGAIRAEVVGFRGADVTLMPLDRIDGVASGAAVRAHGGGAVIRCGQDLLGRVLDGVGEPMDGGAALAEVDEDWPVSRAAPEPLSRPGIEEPLVTGVRAIDGLCTLGVGQRVGLFAGPGVGKSSLLARIAGSASVDVCVLCLVGERGREVRELLDERLSPRDRARTVAVVATSDAPGMRRVRAAATAMAVAEWFRERQGANVLFLMDSLTRLARAQREVGLAAGELPVRHGFPPSVFSSIPRLVERAGTFGRGSITGVFTVLEARANPDDPVADEAQAILDGHIVLDQGLAARGRWPAVDILASVSRVMAGVASAEHQRAAARIRELVAVHRHNEDLLRMGAYRPGADRTLDTALARMDDIVAFLHHEGMASYERCVAGLMELAHGDGGPGQGRRSGPGRGAPHEAADTWLDAPSAWAPEGSIPGPTRG